MTSDPDQIRAQIEETRVNLSQDVNTLADTVNPAHAARRKVASAQSALLGVKDKVMGTASQSVSHTGSAAGDRVSAVQDAAHGTISAAQEKVAAAPSQLRQQTMGSPFGCRPDRGGHWLARGVANPGQPGRGAGGGQGKGSRCTRRHECSQGSGRHSGGLRPAGRRVGQASAADAAATVKEEAVSSAHDVQGQAQDARDTVTDHQS